MPVHCLLPPTRWRSVVRRSTCTGAPRPSSAAPTKSSAASSGTACSGLERGRPTEIARSEEHTSELQSLMRISYAVFCLKKKITPTHKEDTYLDTQNTYTLTNCQSQLDH